MRDELKDICVNARQCARADQPLHHLKRLDDGSQESKDSDEEKVREETPGFKPVVHRADITIHPNGSAISTLIDVTIRLPELNQARVGDAAKKGDKLKRKHYGKVYDLGAIDLVPFPLEVWGFLGAAACDYIDSLARTKLRWHQNPEKCPFYRKHKYQYTGRISSALMRGTGAQLDSYVYRCRRARGLLGADAPLYPPGGTAP